MFNVALLSGIYSYLIFILGVTGYLYKDIIILITLFFALFSLILFKKDLMLSYFNLQKELSRWGKLSIFLFLLIFTQAFINFIGALGPELSFDALWYHLTIPKLFLEQNSLYFIQGNLLYYSLFPKLGETFYIAALAIDGEILAKIIHFTFGILTLVALYKFSRAFLNQFYSLVSVLIFSSNLVFAWQSTTAYIDLFRTFFELLALWAFIKRDAARTGFFTGLAISSKLLSFGSIPIFTLLYIFFEKTNFNKITTFVFIAIIVSLPWFVYSYLNSGHFFYPLFTGLYPDSFILDFNIFRIISDILTLFLYSADPISPIYIILAPLSIFLFKRLDRNLKIIAIYSLLSIIVWYFIPRTGGGRFILPYLFAFSILSAAIISKINPALRVFLIALVIVISMITIFYRGAANYKFIPVILGEQTKHQFLSENLNFQFGDFYDTDGYFKKTIEEGDRVLLYGFHNLYYINFPFIDSSWVEKGDKFNYIAVQGTNMPERFKNWELIYYNQNTGVKLYTDSRKIWTY
jgi:hypothetical protein